MNPQFRPLENGTGFEIFDPIENVRVPVETDHPLDVRTAPTDGFPFPVDSAAAVDASRFRIGTQVEPYVHDGTDVVATDPDRNGLTVPTGEYSLQLQNLPVTLYVSIEGPFELTHGDASVEVEVESASTLVFGVRSKHDHPGATVTTTDDPRDVMTAISTFGTCLKTHSPERSFPTLRGHTPLLERGDRLQIPDSVSPPDTGVTIEVPPDLAAVFGAASLAAYLGATVEPGDTPGVRAAGEWIPLDDGETVADAASSFLRHCFLLDCVVRTEGIYEVDLLERDRLEERTDIDPARLYDLSLDERTAAYAEVPRSDTRAIEPGWHYTADIAADPSSIPYVSYVANTLATIRSPPEGEPRNPPEPSAEVEDFFRGSGDDPASVETAVQPEPVDTYGHMWVADGYPLGASKPTLDSLHRLVDRLPSKDPTISVRVVCNDERMDEEARAELYGLRDLLEFDIQVYNGVSRGDLRELLGEDVDFLHYIGHVDDNGLDCPDGRLDLSALDGTGVDTFLLNACRSYEQGMALVDAGAIGGVTTSTDVPNTVASTAGQTLARLMNGGHTLQSALSVLQYDMASGFRYMIVGNGDATLCQSERPFPHLEVVESLTSETADISSISYPRASGGSSLGGFSRSYLESIDAVYLDFGEHGPFSVPRGELQEVGLESLVPFVFNGGLRWDPEALSPRD